MRTRNYVIGVRNNVIGFSSALGNFVIVDIRHKRGPSGQAPLSKVHARTWSVRHRIRHPERGAAAPSPRGASTLALLQ
jgi:hypothetical protein